MPLPSKIDIALSKKADLIEGKVPFEQLPSMPGMSQVIETFVPQNGQTVFNLINVPNYAEVYINGLQIDQFTIAGKVLTYTGTKFSLSETDIFKVIYYK